MWRQTPDSGGTCDPNLKGTPVLLPDVSAAASCIPELQQCVTARDSAATPAEVSPGLPAPAWGQPSTPGADCLCPGGKPAPAQRIKCDINAGKHARFHTQSLPPKLTRACLIPAVPVNWKPTEPFLCDWG